MSKILEVFGIDWRLLAVNAINFGLLLFALKYFLYGPIMSVLEARRSKVAEGVRNAELAERELQETETARAAVMAKAGKEADSIVARAHTRGTAKEREIIAAGETAAESLIKDAESQAVDIKERAVAESREEVAKLVVLGMEKMMKTKK